jgi:hypothetical protein
LGATFEITRQQAAIGFDTELDSILGDWGKLSNLGPLITNSNYPEFYSPNQVAQNVAVQLLGQGAQRNFYSALLPAFYKVQYYPAWKGSSQRTINPPDMGALASSNGPCDSWYAWYDGSGNPKPGLEGYVDKAYATSRSMMAMFDSLSSTVGWRTRCSPPVD